MATSLKKQIEKAISKKEQKAESIRCELSDLQLAVLERIKRDCEGVRPRWETSKILKCSLVMQGLNRKWTEQRFTFYFQDSASLEGMRLSDFRKSGEFVELLARQVECCVKAFLVEKS